MLTSYTVLFTPGGSATRSVDDWPHSPSVDAIHKLVRPYLTHNQRPERVLVFWEGEYRDMFVGDRSLDLDEPNVRATEVYRNNVLVHDPRAGPADDMPMVYGPAVLFSRRVWL